MIGFLISRLRDWPRRLLTFLVLLIAAAMLAYNLTLVVQYLA